MTGPEIDALIARVESVCLRDKKGNLPSGYFTYPNDVCSLVSELKIYRATYEALKEMLSSFDPYNCRGDFYHHVAIMKARAAIAKAEEV